MPGRHRFFGHRDDDGGIREVSDGGTYTRDEERDGLIMLIIPDPDTDPPPEGSRGEPWDWPLDNEHPYKPRGWNKDDDYGPRYRDQSDPGPYDGEWDPLGGGVSS